MVNSFWIFLNVSSKGQMRSCVVPLLIRGCVFVSSLKNFDYTCSVRVDVGALGEY